MRKLLYARHFPLLPFLSLGVLSLPALGQSANKDQEVAACVRLMRADSVHMFFDKNYALVQPECAVIRRESRMDAQGSFAGEVRDYSQPDNHLLMVVHYVEALRDGPYEQYHPNQQPAVLGQFRKGEPFGTWQYWYADGKPQQTMEVSADGTVRILSYWNAEGKQQVTDGLGSWEEVTGIAGGGVYARNSGRVKDGLMDGKWELRGLNDKQLLIAETYASGRLLEGQHYLGKVGKPRKYTSSRQLGPQPIDASSIAEPFHLGEDCATQAYRKEEEKTSKMLQAGTKAPQPPMPAGEYQRVVLNRLAHFNNMAQWMPRTDGQLITILADVSETGELHNFTCPTAVLASALATITTSMGKWRPATVYDVAVPGKLQFTLRMYANQLQSAMSTMAAYPLPPEVVQRFQKK